VRVCVGIGLGEVEFAGNRHGAAGARAASADTNVVLD
jgi:hypothetical protein